MINLDIQAMSAEHHVARNYAKSLGYRNEKVLTSGLGAHCQMQEQTCEGQWPDEAQELAAESSLYMLGSFLHIHPAGNMLCPLVSTEGKGKIKFLIIPYFSPMTVSCSDWI